jgi:UDP-3-O-[3-hydroxymyristoyl] glucosamine N-acyltransferase
MRLSDYDGKYFSVVRDGSFEVLELVRKRIGRPFLGYAQADSFLRAACDNPDVSCIICPEKLSVSERLLKSGKGIAVSERSDMAFISLHNYLAQTSEEYNFERFETQIGKGCRIHPMASIADRGVKIGDNVIIEEFAVIREGCEIGDNSIIHAGAILGVEHYNLCWDDDGCIFKMQEAGKICIGDNVEVGSYATIGRATFPHGTTVVGKNTCIDNLAVISHNCQVGSNCLIAKSHICGSAILEDGVRVNPMATIKNSVTIGKDAVISLGAVVVSNVPEGSKFSGNFAVEHSKFMLDHLRKLRNK